MADTATVSNKQLYYLDFLLSEGNRDGRKGLSERSPMLKKVMDVMIKLIELGLVEREWHGVDEQGAVGYLYVTERGEQVLNTPEHQQQLQEYKNEILHQTAEWERGYNERRSRR